MAKKLDGRTVAENHEQLVGTKVIIDGWEAVISDTTETASGTVYYSVRVLAAPAIYLENKWMKLA